MYICIYIYTIYEHVYLCIYLIICVPFGVPIWNILYIYTYIYIYIYICICVGTFEISMYLYLSIYAVRSISPWLPCRRVRGPAGLQSFREALEAHRASWGLRGPPRASSGPLGPLKHCQNSTNPSPTHRQSRINTSRRHCQSRMSEALLVVCARKARTSTKKNAATQLLPWGWNLKMWTLGTIFRQAVGWPHKELMPTSTQTRKVRQMLAHILFARQHALLFRRPSNSFLRIL